MPSCPSLGRSFLISLGWTISTICPGTQRRGSYIAGETAGAVVCVIEAMKMENEITAPVSGKVQELSVSEGAAIAAGDAIAVIK
jgi:acetyl/propionyl-CoA carboxylase alpha subunit